MKKFWQAFVKLPMFVRLLSVAGLALLILIVVIGWSWMGSVDTAGEETALSNAPLPVTPNLSGEPVPEAYLFQHFLEEMGNCYRQVSQPLTAAQLEREIGREWGRATQALLDYYEQGLCAERERDLLIPGRAGWLAAQSVDFALNGPEEEQEQAQ